MVSPALLRVEKGRLCAGCGLCAGIAADAVSMEMSPEGFLRPQQSRELTPQQEWAISQSCPGLVASPWGAGQGDGLTGSLRRSPYWGPYRSVETGHAVDPDLRFAGSSGGLISALAEFALESGKVDAVLTNTANRNAPLRNMATLARSKVEVRSAAGSRYAPSSPLHDIDRLLDAGERIFFIGKPCDVSALRQLALVDSRVNRVFPYMVAFFCGGIPSQEGTDEIVRQLGQDPARVETFRYRGNGWPGTVRSVSDDGSVAEMSYEESWGRILSKRVQFRCKICPDAVGGAADIACADAWFGGESGYPQFDDKPGRSLVIARTPTGQLLLDEAIRANAIETEPTSIDDVALMQPSQLRRKALIRARTAAIALLMRPRPRMAGLDVEQASQGASLMDHLRNFAGTALRVLRGPD